MLGPEDIQEKNLAEAKTAVHRKFLLPEMTLNPIENPKHCPGPKKDGVDLNGEASDAYKKDVDGDNVVEAFSSSEQKGPNSAPPDDSEDTLINMRKEEERKEEERKFLEQHSRDLKEVEGVFQRRNGNIYVPVEWWNKYRHLAYNCQLYISTRSTATPAITSNDRILKGFKASSKSRSPSPAARKPLDERISPAGNETDVPQQLPDKLRIMNDHLWTEIRRITGDGNINVDHVPPFRSLIQYEQKIRQRLVEKEKEWEASKSEFPEHPAIRRTEPWLPPESSYGLVLTSTTDYIQTPLDIQRILLDGLRSLVHFLDHDLFELVQTYRKIQSHTIEKIQFAFLWHLFEPGQEIVTKKPNYQVYRVLQVTGGRKSLIARQGKSKNSSRRTISDLTIDCFYLDFDGKNIRPVPKTISIPPYDGLMTVTSLEAYPLIYEKVKPAEELVTRGRKFAELVQVTHRRYRGLSLKEGDWFDRFEEIDSDIIVDFELAFRNSEPKIEMADFGGGVIVKPTTEEEEETIDNDSGISFDDEELMRSRWSQFVHRTHLLEPQSIRDLKRDSLILLPYRVYGYVLLSRKWFPLDIDLVETISPMASNAPDGFDELILPQGHKDVVRALVKTHARVVPTMAELGNREPQRQFDLVKGKGKGLIILLHGAPGVGKTSTAECVASNTGRPLFPITCGDIGGTTAQEVEKNLERFFDLARKWGCVLLLDEADVFLSERIKGDIGQNSLVSVFLRVLEYYSGILILTTNRVGDFDEAIKSRVHCALYYPPLNKKDTFGVWNMNLDRLERENSSPDCKMPIQFDRKEIEKFAKRHWKDGNRWNGRQIKNAFQTAVALADWDNLKENAPNGHDTKFSPQLTRKHFETVAAASAHFDRYLMEVRNSDQHRAKTQELRRDDLRRSGSPPKVGKSSKLKKGQLLKAPWPEWGRSDRSESDSSSSDSSSSGTSSSSESSSEEEVKKKKSKHREKKGKEDHKKKKEKRKRREKDEPKEKSSKEKSAPKASSSESDSE